MWFQQGVQQPHIHVAQQLQIQRAIPCQRSVALQGQLRGLAGRELTVQQGGVALQLRRSAYVDRGQPARRIVGRAHADRLGMQFALRQVKAAVHVGTGLDGAVCQQPGHERIDQLRLQILK